MGAAASCAALAHSDRGVVMLRKLMLDQQERVRQGLDPMGVIRDPDHAMIDTNLQKVLDELRVGSYGPNGINTPTYEVGAPT